jgi:hypothetical protein
MVTIRKTRYLGSTKKIRSSNSSLFIFDYRSATSTNVRPLVLLLGDKWVAEKLTGENCKSAERAFRPSLRKALAKSSDKKFKGLLKSLKAHCAPRTYITCVNLNLVSSEDRITLIEEFASKPPQFINYREVKSKVPSIPDCCVRTYATEKIRNLHLVEPDLDMDDLLS